MPTRIPVSTPGSAKPSSGGRPRRRGRTRAGPARFRTFEAEELVEDAAAGASPETFGCRYTHAEYGGDASADYFRCNTLISEYFGTEEEEPATSGGPDAGGSPDAVPSLLVCLGFDRASPGEGVLRHSRTVEGHRLVLDREAEPCASARLIEISSPDDCFLCYADRNVNFPRVGFGSTDLDRLARTTFDALAEALSQDLDVNQVDEVSFTFEWSDSELTTRLSVAGRASCVLSLLQAMSGIVCPAQEAARWVGPLRARISEIVHADKPSSQAPAVLISEEGTLRVAHSGTPRPSHPAGPRERLKSVLQDPLALKKGGDRAEPFSAIGHYRRTTRRRAPRFNEGASGRWGLTKRRRAELNRSCDRTPPRIRD